MRTIACSLGVHQAGGRPAVEVDLEAFDRALASGALPVAQVVADEVLRMVPVNLLEVVSLDADVPALALL